MSKPLALLIYILIGFHCFLQNNTYSPILPSPVVYKQTPGKLYLPQGLSIKSSQFSKEALIQFKLLLSTFHSLDTKEAIDRPLIRLRELKNVPNGSYSIAISDDIFISYASESALYYAMQSLMQLIQTENDFKYIQNAFVQDYPKFEWRGLHLDVSRHFFSVEEVKRYLDLMAIYKFNKFHWHLTDDQGWRIEIKAFPKLTTIGAWRDSTLLNHYTTTPRSFKKERHGGFYTQEEIKEVVAYAGKRHITVIPEIEMPGHSRAALAAYPEFSCTGIAQGVPGIWGVFEDVYCAKEESLTFLKKVLDEVTELFPGEYIHIGGDEAPKTQWNKCEQCQEVIKVNKLKDAHELQSYFITQIEKYLTTKNKRIIGWDEILEGGLSPDATVMSWRGFDGGIEACKKEHYVIMSPGSHCYFDHYQGKTNNEPLAIGGFTSLEKVYQFNPIPKELDAAHANYILGGQANLWTEYISTFKQLEYMAYPRAIALSQTLWCTEKPDYETFYSILSNGHLKQLDLLHVNYSKTSQLANINTKTEKKGLRIELESKDQEEEFKARIQYQNKLEDLDFILKNKQHFIIERTKNETQKIKVSFTSSKTGLNSDLLIENHKALGIPVRYLTQPNQQYNHSPSILTDGQRGSQPWRGHEWIGFDTNIIVFEIELPKKIKIKHVDLSFLKSNGSWIYLPNEIKIENCSKRRNNIFLSQKIDTEIIKVKMGQRSKKLRFQIQTNKLIPIGLPGNGHKPWTFIDEIVIH
tara:strand:- start:1684 stop:3930 length:2247 start_codon:yes stop_codon:yes gene_type:complete